MNSKVKIVEILKQRKEMADKTRLAYNRRTMTFQRADARYGELTDVLHVLASYDPEFDAIINPEEGK